ncbi:hypothetical protein RAZWK3B_11296 [Roseobacter sp. AzwK-3b]|uniref:YHS domain-containing (seleno)protein n=1 Tax=Roseobacter sp. AzwK-3b TaxID=351016 RepID=UPI000156AEC0|nr:YHS domain-containing (seleno)protein [Roseobacter sp. AzwK-3b]EDM70190.1 hypothetical protein RAZWK3B_11296 [Roseobacter sp. AzwK-3b]
MLTRRLLLAGLAAGVPAALLLKGQPAHAAEPEVFLRDGLAANGHDPVAYFTEGKAVEGRAEHALVWKDVEWRFSSEANRAAFEADPEAYAPQYGGYCAYAVSQGYTASTDPRAWSIHEGRLYLNYNRAVRALWARDIPGRIRSADENWPSVLQG